MREAYVDDKDTYEGGEDEEELDVVDEEGDALFCKLAKFDFDKEDDEEVEEDEESPQVFIMTSSRVCTNSSVFGFKY